MAIPQQKEIGVPLLNYLKDGKIHKLKDAVLFLGKEFSLTPQELHEMLPSQSDKKFANRVAWVRQDLINGGLIKSIGYGQIMITDSGLELLKNPPTELGSKVLRQLPIYQEYLRRDKNNLKEKTIEDSETLSSDKPDVSNPLELIQTSFQQVTNALVSELIATIKACSPEFFERLVVRLLVGMGYGGSYTEVNTAVVGKSGDGGIDGIIKEDKLGLDSIYVQAKRWEGGVGRPQIQAFAGALEGRRAKKGVFITTSSYSDEAKKYVEQIEKKIVLIDGNELAELMIDYNIGVSTVDTYLIKKIDSDFFSDE